MVDYNEKLTLALCKELGFFKHGHRVCTDLEMVQKEIDAEELELEGALEWRKLNHELRKAGLSLQQARQIRSMLEDPSFRDGKASNEQNMAGDACRAPRRGAKSSQSPGAQEVA